MLRALPVLALLLLAGCAGPNIPDDAVEVTHDGLQGATMWAWLEDEEEANFTTIKAHFAYRGDQLLHSKWSDPLGQWNLTILDANGTSLIYDERPSRKAHYNPEGYHVAEDFSFLWTHEEYERYSQPVVAEDIPKHRVPAGNYTVILQYRVATPFLPDSAFEAVLPLVVS